MQFSIKKIETPMKVYDIEVDETHNFSFGKGNYIAHNCFAGLLNDTIESIQKTSSESRMLAVVGGGVGLHVGLRPGDKKSSGIIPHLKTYDADTLAFKQGTTRRGATAAYLDINHPEIIEFLEMRKVSGGDPNRKCINLHHGVNISDDFMRRIEKLSLVDGLSQEEKDDLDNFPLINPHTKEIVEYVSAKQLWERLITVRAETGEPYFWFIDRANEYLPWYQKAIGLRNNGSNLCSEISLSTSDERTFVCCLSSVNLETYDEWKNDPQFISDIVEMLDNVITVFINKASKIPYMERAVFSAMRERAIGIGGMGWHSLLQKRGIPFESALAVGLNKQIWNKMNAQGMVATQRLAIERGACPDAADYDVMVRNSHIFSIAPNASSSIILNTSPSIEPYRANIFNEKGVNGLKSQKNKWLVKLLQEKGKDTQEVWSEIISNAGSVRTLDFLTEYEKDVFKTAIEIDQVWVVQHAADRQPYICQAQSTNLFFAPDANVEYVHLVHLMAWQNKLKSLYYYRSDAIHKADKLGKKVERERIETLAEMAMNAASGEVTCAACEG